MFLKIDIKVPLKSASDLYVSNVKELVVGSGWTGLAPTILGIWPGPHVPVRNIAYPCSALVGAKSLLQGITFTKVALAY